MPSTGEPSIVTEPASGATSPARTLRKVDFPLPIDPTMETNSPRSTDRHTSRSTGLMSLPVPNDLPTPETSMNDIALQTHRNDSNDPNDPNDPFRPSSIWPRRGPSVDRARTR